ncbi:MAG: arginine--tRNA ligase [Phototrophicaceae bacterium]
MILLPQEHAKLVHQAIVAAQASHQLPPFDIPEISIEPTKKVEFGDYSSSIAMKLAKIANLKPADIAQIIVAHLPSADFVASAELAGAFINFRLNESWLKQQVNAIIQEGEQVFALSIGRGKRAQVEFVSANPTGPLHIGRSRGAIVGDAMARVLEAVGYAVEREYYFNNAGVQMRNLGQSLHTRYREQLGQEAVYPLEYKGDYLITFAQEIVAQHGDGWLKEDWATFKEYAEHAMFKMIRETLHRVDIRHDTFFNENSLFDSGEIDAVIGKLKASGDLYEASVWEGATPEEVEKEKNNDPAWWFRSTRYGDDKDRVLLKADGNATYTLPDFAYHMNKLERGFDVLVNVLGADHGAQYKVVQHGVEALGGDPSKIHVIIVQMVRMMKEGKEVKLSTRRGDYVTLDDLMDMTSVDAVRYMLLARHANSHLDFDLDRAVARNNDNPVYYIQNAHVRCAGIFREAKVREIPENEDANLELLTQAELRFLRKAMELGNVLMDATHNYEPHRIAFFAHELSSVFHPIYDEVRVLHSEIPTDLAQARLRFYQAAQIILKRLLSLMGMSAPETM